MDAHHVDVVGKYEPAHAAGEVGPPAQFEVLGVAERDRGPQRLHSLRVTLRSAKLTRARAGRAAGRQPEAPDQPAAKFAVAGRQEHAASSIEGTSTTVSSAAS